MKHLVIGNMKHDGKRLKIGAQVELDDDKAARLVAGGFAVAMRADVPAAAEGVDDADKTKGKK